MNTTQKPILTFLILLTFLLFCTMITREIVNKLYKKYAKAPKSTDMLNMPLLFDCATEFHGVYVDPDTNALVISSIDPASPFHSIPLRHIHAIVPFEEWVAIVLHSSIIFLNKKNSKVAVDIKALKPSFMDRLRGITVE